MLQNAHSGCEAQANAKILLQSQPILAFEANHNSTAVNVQIKPCGSFSNWSDLCASRVHAGRFVSAPRPADGSCSLQPATTSSSEAKPEHRDLTHSTQDRCHLYSLQSTTALMETISCLRDLIQVH